MSLPVSLDAVAEELGALLDETTAFINRRTGEIASVSTEEAALLEEDVEEGDVPDWQTEMIPKLREILSGGDWSPLPTKFDVHEWEIMRKFGDTVEDSALANRLHRAIHGKGAFRLFHATVHDAGLRDNWYTFRHRMLREIAKEALEDLGVSYR